MPLSTIPMLILTTKCSQPRCNTTMPMVDAMHADIYVTWLDGDQVFDTDSFHYGPVCEPCHADITKGCTHENGDAWTQTLRVPSHVAQVTSGVRY